MICLWLLIFLCVQGTGLVQFETEQARNAALKLHKSQFHGKEIVVQPSKFPLIPVQNPVQGLGDSSEQLQESKPSSSQPDQVPNVQKPKK